MPFSWNHHNNVAGGCFKSPVTVGDDPQRLAESSQRQHTAVRGGSQTMLSDGFSFLVLMLLNTAQRKIVTTDERVQDNRRNIIYFPNKNTLLARIHVNKSKTKTTNS